MALLGNLLLFLSAFVFVGLLSLMNRPVPGGDAGVGYAWSLIFLNLALIILLALAYLVIGQQGGFSWVPGTSGRRFWLVGGGLAAALITTAVTSFVRSEGGANPAFLKAISTVLPILIPLLLIGAGFILVNGSIRTAVPEALYRLPLYVAGLLGAVGVGVGLISWMAVSAQRQATTLKAMADRSSSNDLRILGEIDSCNVMKSIYPILIFTGDNQPDNIRKKAVAKIKTNPNWQAELLQMIGQRGTTEAFQFLASNEVDEPALFVEPIREGIYHQADAIRERIRRVNHSSNFYAGMLGWETQWVLRTAEKFEPLGGDYVDAVKAFRAAMDEPSDFEKTEFTAMRTVDKWIKKRSR